ncbi:hypothetical protein FB444_11727 [Vibrio crassostreae]|nr:hypothetical protein EDB16_11782 [Vibrio crassostreae]TWD59030.1 hypothetical protein FB444_11727 [Vibrio crassostreae]
MLVVAQRETYSNEHTTQYHQHFLSLIKTSLENTFGNSSKSICKIDSETFTQ